METILHIITILVVAIAFSASFAHAIEFPGKLRLTEEEYKLIQPVYYPGFTVAGGIGEAGGILLISFLLFFLDAGAVVFNLTIAALISLIFMQASYWILTHPVNQFWLRKQKLKSFSKGFFSFMLPKHVKQHTDWKALRNRWEYSHVIRAIFAFLSLLFLIIALSLY